MRGIWGIGCLAVLTVGCARGVGYARPADRNIEHIGAPVVGEVGGGLKLSGSNDKNALVFTESGSIVATGRRTITLRRPSGEESALEIQALTSITMEGRPVALRALPEGAQVRASYVMQGRAPIADRIEAQPP